MPNAVALILLLLIQVVTLPGVGAGCGRAGGPACCQSAPVVVLPGERPCCAARRIAGERIAQQASGIPVVVERCCGSNDCRCHVSDRSDEAPPVPATASPRPEPIDVAPAQPAIGGAARGEFEHPHRSRPPGARVDAHNRRLARLGRRRT